MNFRLIMLSGLLFGATGAAAAPPIAYAQVSGNGNEVWLVNTDGSGAKRIYSAASTTPISSLDVRPGGGQLAITESHGSIFRLINYDAAGNPTGTSLVPLASGCQVGDMDYHPTDGSLIFTESCAGGTDKRVEIYASGQVSDVIAGLTVSPDHIRWLRDGSGFLWRTSSSSLGTASVQLRKSSIANPSSFTVLWQMPTGQGVQSMDIAHTTDAFLLTWSGPPAYVYRYTFDFTSVTNQGVVANGQNGHYSADDTALLYRVQTRNTGYNLVITDAHGTRTVASGSRIGPADWQQ